MTRESFCIEAKTWIGTPYVFGQRVKGHGVDCATFIAEVLIACGLAEREELGVYSHDWFCNTREERYMLRLLRHSRKTLDTIACGTLKFEPGSIVLTRAVGSKVFNHGGIYVGNNRVIHALDPEVIESEITSHWLWTFHPISVFDPFKRPE